MSTYEVSLLLSCLVLLLVLAGLGYDFLRGDIRPRQYHEPDPSKPGPCVHCGRDYHDHEAKHHFCPKTGGWAEVTFQEGVDE